MNSFVIPLAHGLGGRDDLALPGWLFSWAAAIVLAVSFFALAALWTSPKLETAKIRWLLRFPRFLEPICGLLGVAAFAWLAYYGFVGSQNVDSNPVPTVVFVFFWTVIPLLSAIFGDIFRPFNPWRAVGLAAAKLNSRRGGEHPARFAYPDKLGRWPAVAGLFVFGWVELVSSESIRGKPSTLAALMLAYAAIQLLGMTLFGARTWLERADAFGVYFNFFSRISPLLVRERRLGARLPLAGLTEITPMAATVPFVGTMIGITVFDGFSAGGIWESIAGKDPSVVISTVGFAAAILLVLGFYRLGVLGMEGREINRSAGELSQMFAPSLVPIALGYLIAHYFSFMIFVGQGLPHVLAHPMGDAGPPAIDYFMSSKAIWWVQVAALLVGHVAGLASAHDKAISVWGKARAAVQSQTWMLVVMVGFTSLGLWLLSQST